MDMATLINELQALSLELRETANGEIYAEDEEEWARLSERAENAELLANRLDGLIIRAQASPVPQKS